MRIDPESASLTFAARLARENGWSPRFAQRVFEEYKRFLYLAATSGHPVTPSDEVDQAWHLHLTYTRHYWDVLCAQILERPLHHGPTEGGAAEDQRYRAQYQATLATYTATFGAEPPIDIWPPTAQRFGTAYRRVVDGQHWMIRKKPVYGALPMLALAACTSAEVGAAGVLAVMMLIIAALTMYGAGSFWISTNDGKDGKDKDGGGCGSFFFGGSSSDSSDGGDSSGCGGGCGGGCSG